MQPQPRPPRSWAITLGLLTAIVLAVLSLTAGLWDPVVAIPQGIVFLAVAIGIKKRRAWSAYGGALFVTAQTASGIVGLLRTSAENVPWGTVTVGVGLCVVAALLLFRAGRRIAVDHPPGPSRVWIALATVTFLIPVFLRPYVISTGSMENTVVAGDHILVRQLGGISASRGDVVQVASPVNPGDSFIKRVVAVGGDRVRLNNKTLVVNGVPVNEPYALHTTASIDAFRDNFPQEPRPPLMREGWEDWLKQNAANDEVVVPQGKYFVLGDNRDNSLDSRYWGFLERKDLLGKPVMIYFSANLPPQDANNPALPEPILLHPDHIRWSRLFHLL